MKKMLILITLLTISCRHEVYQPVTETYVTDTTYFIAKDCKMGKHRIHERIKISKEEYEFLKEKNNIDLEIELPKIYVKNSSGGRDIEITQQQLDEFNTQINPKVKYYE